MSNKLVEWSDGLSVADRCAMTILRPDLLRQRRSRGQYDWELGVWPSTYVGGKVVYTRPARPKRFGAQHLIGDLIYERLTELGLRGALASDIILQALPEVRPIYEAQPYTGHLLLAVIAADRPVRAWVTDDAQRPAVLKAHELTAEAAVVGLQIGELVAHVNRLVALENDRRVLAAEVDRRRHGLPVAA